MSPKQMIKTTIAEPFPVDFGQGAWASPPTPAEAAALTGARYPADSAWFEPYHPATYRLRSIRAEALRRAGWTVTVEVEDVK